MQHSDRKDGPAKKGVSPAWIVAIVAGVFCIALTLLMVSGYLQILRADPLNTPALTQLVSELDATPENATLRNAVREMDLISRRAFFTNQVQVRVGALLLLSGAIVLLLALKRVSQEQARVLLPDDCPGRDNPHETAILARRYLAAGAVALVIISVVAGLTTPTLLTPAVATAPAPIDIAPLAAIPVVPAARPTPSPLPAPSPEIVIDLTRAWTAFRGHDGNATATNRSGILTHWNGETAEGILWKAPVPRPGYSSPIVCGERVFLSGADADTREIYCFDARTGQQLWRRDVTWVPGSPEEPPEVTDDTGYAASTMATDGARVFAIYANGDLAGFSIEGDELWSRNLGVPENHYGHSSSLIMWKHMLIVQYDHSDSTRLLGLDGRTGATIWVIDRQASISWASPIVVRNGKRDEVIVATSTTVSSHDPATGDTYWSTECMAGEVAPSPAFGNGITYVANDMASAVALDSEGMILWEVDDLDLPDVASPLLVSNRLILASSTAVLTCLDAATGETVWVHESESGAGFYASPLLLGTRVYAVDMEGVTHIFEIGDTYNPLATPALGEAMVATPACVDGRLFMRGKDSLYCIGSDDD